jgi:hypothetical protein
MLLPVTREDVRAGLGRLRIHPLLQGFRGAPPVAMEAVIDAVMAVQLCVAATRERLYELEINPLICTARGAYAADALIGCLADEQGEGDRDGPDQDPA